MSTTDRSRRLLGSTPLILVAMFAAGAALLTLLYWGLHLSKSIGMHYSTTVSAAVPLEQRPDLWTTSPADIQFTSVDIRPVEPESRAVFLESLSVSGRYLVGFLACLTILAVCLMLLRRRTPGRLTSWWLAGLGGLMVLVALAEPWLSARAQAVTVAALGLPTTAEATGLPPESATWVVPHPYDWTDTSWFLLLLGLLIVMGAVALFRSHRDAEGLI